MTDSVTKHSSSLVLIQFSKDSDLIKATIRSKEIALPLHQTLVFICSYKGELILLLSISLVSKKGDIEAMSAVKYEVLISLQLMPWTMGNGHPPNITQMREHV